MSALPLLLVLAAVAPHAGAAVRTAPKSAEPLSLATDNAHAPQEGAGTKSGEQQGTATKGEPSEVARGVGESAPVLALETAACPTADAVERRLAALRAPGAAAVWYRVDVHRAPDALTVRAVTAAGDTRLERKLPASGPCEELEQAAAVVLLAWEAQLPPGSVPVPRLERREVAAASAPEPKRERLRVSAQGAAWLSSAAPAGGGAGSLEWRFSRLPLALALDVFGQGRRTVKVAEGTGTWARLSFALGVTGSLSLDERVSVTLGLGVAGGPFWVDGANYQTNHNELDWDLGLTARALLYLPGLGPVRPFVGVNGVVWLRQHVAQETGPNGGQRLLPTVEAAPCAGLALTL